MDYLPLSVGIGLAVSLLFSELFGIAAGGMIVPGYLALSITRPVDVALTIAGGLLTYAIVHTLSSFIIIYGRRRTVAMIIIGYLIGMVVRQMTHGVQLGPMETDVIGYIIPGLIAIWFDRQGIVETLSALVTASVVVRLLLLLILGAELSS